MISPREDAGGEFSLGHTRGSPSNSVPHEEIWALFRAPPGPDAAKGIVFVADS